MAFPETPTGPLRGLEVPMSDTFTVELASDCDAITVHSHGFAFRVAEDGWQVDSRGQRAQYRYTISARDGIEWRTIADASDLRGPAMGSDPGAVEMFGTLCSFLDAYAEALAYSDSENRDLFPVTCVDMAEAIGSGGSGGFAMLACDVACEALRQRAAELGRDAGRAAGTWVFDGNSTEETMRALLRMDEEGDPAIWDMLPSAPLSGEWADGPTPASLMQEIGAEDLRDMLGSPDDALMGEIESQVCTAFEDAWHTAMVDEAVRYARAVLGIELEGE
jgi:hypothetical protein